MGIINILNKCLYINLNVKTDKILQGITIQEANFIELLNALPSHDWNQFFALIFETNLGDLMDAGLIGRILNEIQEAQHNEFLNAIARYIPSVFSGVHDIVFLLIVTPIYNWEKIVRYFEGRIE